MVRPSQECKLKKHMRLANLCIVVTVFSTMAASSLFGAEKNVWKPVEFAILRFNDELIKVFGKLSKQVLADTAAKDPLTRKVYDSYMAFLAGVMDWGELSETGYRDTRRLALA